MDKPYIKTLHIGKIEPLANTEFLSAINKQKTDIPQQVSVLGLVTDKQSDKIHHGGKEKAIHQYALENYTYWKDLIPDCRLLQSSGAFGENISSLGMTEDTVMIGDVYKVGNCILEVSQARQPCWKLNYHFGYAKMSEEVQNSLKTGWYYRVIQEGYIQHGDSLELLERPYPDYSLIWLLNLLYKDCLNFEKLTQAEKIKPLAVSWKQIFSQRLETKTVENWSRRLFK